MMLVRPVCRWTRLRGLRTTSTIYSHCPIRQCHTSIAPSSSLPRRALPAGPGLEHFLTSSTSDGSSGAAAVLADLDDYGGVDPSVWRGDGRRVHLEVYGCQMNVSDADIVRSIVTEAGYTMAATPADSDAVLLLTCSIRDGAERRVLKRLQQLATARRQSGRPRQRLGVLGCMAERLKHRLVEESGGVVDLIAGPDSYRHLPRLLAVPTDRQAAVHVQLSLDETYADVRPVRRMAATTADGTETAGPTAFVSVMRGCDNMCTYCVVPFTRGRERTRPLPSIVDEVRQLVDDGVREVTLLGQNVNSYRDKSGGGDSSVETGATRMARGFSTVYKTRSGGRRFAELLAAVSDVDPDLRVRFTSPHPKDFPDELLQLIGERPNLCSCLHLPAQAGSSQVLAAMGRGYTREAYLELVAQARSLIPDLAITSDFIAGFCGETEEQFQETLSLLREVRYNFCYLYAYSMRSKTRAFHRMKDDVPSAVKTRRRRDMVSLNEQILLEVNSRQIGRVHLVLLESHGKRVQESWFGRNDGNTKVMVQPPEDWRQPLSSGDYVAVEVVGCESDMLYARPIRVTTLQEFTRDQQTFLNAPDRSAQMASGA